MVRATRQAWLFAATWGERTTFHGHSPPQSMTADPGLRPWGAHKSLRWLQRDGNDWDTDAADLPCASCRCGDQNHPTVPPLDFPADLRASWYVHRTVLRRSRCVSRLMLK